MVQKVHWASALTLLHNQNKQKALDVSPALFACHL
jgi:hypothetical protein